MHDSNQRERTERPQVSVVVRTKERPELLREALASLAAQTYSPIEAVIVNDGGVDVAEIIDDFQSDIDHIQYIHQSESGGRAYAANVGLQSARGEWIGFLDDDDLYEPDALRILISSGTEAGASVVYGQVIREHYRPDGSRDPEMPDYLYARSFDRDLLYWQNYIPINALIFKKLALPEIRAFDNNLFVTEDWDFILRLAKNLSCMCLSWLPIIVVLVLQRLQEDVLPERKCVKMKIQFTKNGGTKLTLALFTYLDNTYRKRRTRNGKPVYERQRP